MPTAHYRVAVTACEPDDTSPDHDLGLSVTVTENEDRYTASCCNADDASQQGHAIAMNPDAAVLQAAANLLLSMQAHAQAEAAADDDYRRTIIFTLDAQNPAWRDEYDDADAYVEGLVVLRAGMDDDS